MDVCRQVGIPIEIVLNNKGQGNIQNKKKEPKTNKQKQRGYTRKETSERTIMLGKERRGKGRRRIKERGAELS